jgi:hypothetical protein
MRTLCAFNVVEHVHFIIESPTRETAKILNSWVQHIFFPDPQNNDLYTEGSDRREKSVERSVPAIFIGDRGQYNSENLVRHCVRPTQKGMFWSDMIGHLIILNRDIVSVSTRNPNRNNYQ